MKKVKKCFAVSILFRIFASDFRFKRNLTYTIVEEQAIYGTCAATHRIRD